MIRKFLYILFVSIGTISVLLLLLAYLTPYINPILAWYVAIIGLVYPIILLVNIILLFLSFFFKKKLFRYILIIAILSGYTYHHRFFALHLKNKSNITTNDIRILSYNVKTFDLYNWTHNTFSRKKIIHFIDSIAPDIICFQEYLTDDRNIINTTDTLSDLLNISHIHQFFPHKNLYFNFGMATFSRYPIIKKKEIFFKESFNFALVSDIVKAPDTIRIFNCHLQSIHLGKKEYNLLDSISNVANKQKIKEVTPLLKLLRKAYRKRAHQVKIIENAISSSPYPVIVCGDFNDPPNSYTYQILSKNLYDSFLEAGNGFGYTYNKFIIPYRIDFILYNDFFNAVYAQKFKIPYSDHFPYFTVLQKKEVLTN